MSTIKVADLQHLSNSTNSISIASDSSVALKHSGNQKLTTTANGIDVSGVCNATSFTGDASNLQTSASNLTSGTIPDARFPATLPAVSGANLTGLSAGALEYVTEQRVLGSNTSTYIEFDDTIIQPNQEYLLIGLVKLAYGAGATLCIDTEIKDTANTIYNYRYGYNSCFTKTWGSTGYSNQTSSYWYLYDGGYNTDVINFQARITTKTYPRMQYWGHGAGGAGSAGYYMVEGNGWWQNNPHQARVNKIRFADNYGSGFVAPSHVTLFKYVGGYWS